jgi:hypothetical protein
MVIQLSYEMPKGHSSPLVELGPLLGEFISQESNRFQNRVSVQSNEEHQNHHHLTVGTENISPEETKINSNLIVAPIIRCLSASVNSILDTEAVAKPTDEFDSGDTSIFIRFFNGNTYDGCLVNGQMHGPRGRYVWSRSGTVFFGGFLQNRIEGKGTFSWSDRTTYDGQVHNNVRNGQGIFPCSCRAFHKLKFYSSTPI